MQALSRPPALDREAGTPRSRSALSMPAHDSRSGATQAP